MRVHQPIENYFERLLADRSQFAYQLHLNFAFLNIMTAGFIFGIFDGNLDGNKLLLWVSGLIAIVLLEMLLYSLNLFYKDALPTWVWELLYLLLNLLGCIGVGSGIWLIQDSQMFESSLYITIITLIYAVVLYGSHLFNVRVFAICLSGLLLPTVFFYASRGTAQGFLFMIAFLVAGFMLVTCAYVSSRFFKAASLNRYQIEQLSKKLHVEKEITEIALELANSTSQAKNMFFATANHDMRQPLHALSLLVGALKLEKNLTHQAQNIAEQMTVSVNTLTQMFNHFLDINHIETGQLQVNLQTIELNTVLQELIVLHRLSAAEKGLELRMSPTTIKVHTDAQLLTRILSNIIGNAITYTNHGSIWIGYRNAIKSIEIRDSGIGVAPENHESIFKDFYQVQPHAIGKHQGYGLGLPIVRRLSNILHIPITFNSTLGKGSIFKLHIHPVDETKFKPQTPSPSIANNMSDNLIFKNKNVLLIESDEETRHVLMSILTVWGIQPRVALSSGAALKLMSSSDETDEWWPDFIISDYHLGQKTWLELVLSVREASDNNQSPSQKMQKWYCPIVFITSDTSIIRTHLGVRNSSIVFKPIQAEALLNSILSLSPVL